MPLKIKVAVVTFLTFWGLYLFSGLSLFSTGVLSVNRSDVLFHSDFFRVIKNVTIYKINLWRTHTHPLFVVIFNPIGFILRKITGSAEVSLVLLSSLFGAICVVLALTFFLKVGLKPLQAILYSTILGLSTSHLFFSSVPDTFIFAASSLVLLYWLAVHYPGNLVRFVPAGTFALGMVITNFLQSVIIYFFSLYETHLDENESNLKRNFFVKLRNFIVLVLACAVILNILQKLIYPSADLFFLPGSYYKGETAYMNQPQQATDFLSRIVKLLGYFFVYNFLAIKPNVWRTSADNPPPWVNLSASPAPWVNFDPPSLARLYAPGMIAALLGIALLVWALYAFIKFRHHKMPIMRSLLGCILFNFLLHNIYGKDHELFLFTPNWTFLIISWIAISLSLYSHKNNRASTVLNILLIGFVITQALNNTQFLTDLVMIYKQAKLSVNI